MGEMAEMAERDTEGTLAPARSEQVQEVLSEPPAMLVRGGAAVALGVLCLSLVGSAFVSHPETLSGHARIVLRAPPVAVVPRVDRRIERLLVDEGSLVTQRQRLAILESTGAALDVLRLFDAVNTLILAGTNSDELVLAALPDGLRLGDITREYGHLRVALMRRQGFLESETLGKRIRQLETQARERTALERELEGSVDGRRTLREVGEEVLRAKQRLRDVAVISEIEVLETQRQTLADRLAETDAAVAIRESRVARAQIALEKAELQQVLADDLLRLDVAVEDAWSELRAALAAWHFEHVLEAPVAGKVSFFDVWADQQLVRSDKESIFIVPQHGEVTARMTMSQEGFGKVVEGQRVVLQLDSYPMHQFGVVEARVARVSSTAKDRASAAPSD